MLDAHIPLIEEAGEKAFKNSLFSRSFTGLIFALLKIQSGMVSQKEFLKGRATQKMMELARNKMVIIVPIYEEEMPGVYYTRRLLSMLMELILVSIERTTFLRSLDSGKNSSLNLETLITQFLKQNTPLLVFIFVMTVTSQMGQDVLAKWC